MAADCPFCTLARGDPAQHLTEWFYLDRTTGVVAVEDLNPRGYTLRVLVVHQDHVPQGQVSNWVDAQMRAVLFSVEMWLKLNRNLKMVHVDYTASYPHHHHVQGCFERREE